MKDDIVMYGLDQFLPTKKENQQRILGEVDRLMSQALEENNIEVVGNYMDALTGVSQISGLAFSKFVYLLTFQWKNFNQHETLYEWASTRLGREKKAVDDNYRVWEMVVSGDVPKEYCDLLIEKPIRTLIPIGNLWYQGFEVASNQWLALANAPDPATINKIVREIKGVKPKKGSIQIEMTDDGTLYAWKNDKRYFVGSLDVQNKDEVVQKAIARLIGDGRVMEK